MEEPLYKVQDQISIKHLIVLLNTAFELAAEHDREGANYSLLLAIQSLKDFTETESNWHWWPWIPPIFEYQGSVVAGIERSELRQVRKKALDKSFDINTSAVIKEIGEKLASLHFFPHKKRKAKTLIEKILKLIDSHIEDSYVAYPIPIYAPKLPTTLRIESFRKEELAEQDRKNGIGNKTKEKVSYEGDLSRVSRETYAFTKELISLIDLNHPERIPIY